MDELMSSMELRDRIREEKNAYEKEEVRERFGGVDTLMRAEFQRKEESIKAL